jgi:hypothetical protein
MLGQPMVGGAGRGPGVVHAAEDEQRTFGNGRGHCTHADRMQHNQIGRESREEAAERRAGHPVRMKQLPPFGEARPSARFG